MAITVTTIDEMFSRVARQMEQHIDEIKPFVSWAIESVSPLTRILEIGIRHGGTSQLWCELVRDEDNHLVIAIDWDGADSLGQAGTVSLMKEMSQEYNYFKPII